ncbi:MAG: hypothetical protein ACR2PM_12405 [Hyphomicrobiales bacterium]
MSRRRWKILSVAVAAAVAALLVLRGAGGDDANFSQFAGFADYFARNPPGADPPSAEDRALLTKHRPRFYLPADHAGLISFYDDYIAQGVLTSAGGEVISGKVSPALLNAHRHDPAVVFTHRPDRSQPNRPAVFGRIDRDQVAFEDGSRQTFTFLTYHAVFRHSGLAAGLSGWQATAAWLAGDLDDWHQLDHYTAATLVLDEALVPAALLLQQHNNQRTYLIGEGYSLPADGRPRIDVAVRSNELYPHAAGRRRHRAVRFPTPDAYRFLLGIGARPFVSADDITEPAAEARYALHFLAPSDAFYTFKGYLGERRMLPGRDGPPGADYNTLPMLKPWRRQLLAGYWRPGNRGDGARFEQALTEPNWMLALLRRQAAVFRANLLCARRGGADCVFE